MVVRISFSDSEVLFRHRIIYLYIITTLCWQFSICIVLHCYCSDPTIPILYCIILYCITVLYCIDIVLYYTILYCTIEYCMSIFKQTLFQQQSSQTCLQFDDGHRFPSMQTVVFLLFTLTRAHMGVIVLNKPITQFSSSHQQNFVIALLATVNTSFYHGKMTKQLRILNIDSQYHYLCRISHGTNNDLKMVNIFYICE